MKSSNLATITIKKQAQAKPLAPEKRKQLAELMPSASFPALLVSQVQSAPSRETKGARTSSPVPAEGITVQQPVNPSDRDHKKINPENSTVSDKPLSSEKIVHRQAPESVKPTNSETLIAGRTFLTTPLRFGINLESRIVGFSAEPGPVPAQPQRVNAFSKFEASSNTQPLEPSLQNLSAPVTVTPQNHSQKSSAGSGQPPTLLETPDVAKSLTQGTVAATPQRVGLPSIGPKASSMNANSAHAHIPAQTFDHKHPTSDAQIEAPLQAKVDPQNPAAVSTPKASAFSKNEVINNSSQHQEAVKVGPKIEFQPSSVLQKEIIPIESAPVTKTQYFSNKQAFSNQRSPVEAFPEKEQSSDKPSQASQNGRIPIEGTPVAKTQDSSNKQTVLKQSAPVEVSTEKLQPQAPKVPGIFASSRLDGAPVQSVQTRGDLAFSVETEKLATIEDTPASPVVLANKIGAASNRDTQKPLPSSQSPRQESIPTLDQSSSAKVTQLPDSPILSSSTKTKSKFSDNPQSSEGTKKTDVPLADSKTNPKQVRQDVVRLLNELPIFIKSNRPSGNSAEKNSLGDQSKPTLASPIENKAANTVGELPPQAQFPLVDPAPLSAKLRRQMRMDKDVQPDRGLIRRFNQIQARTLNHPLKAPDKGSVKPDPVGTPDSPSTDPKAAPKTVHTEEKRTFISPEPKRNKSEEVIPDRAAVERAGGSHQEAQIQSPDEVKAHPAESTTKNNLHPFNDEPFKVIQRLHNFKELADKIQAQAKLLNFGEISEIQIKLVPPQLGLLQIRIESYGAEVKLNITTERPEAAATIADVRQDLSAIMAAQGFMVTQCEIESRAPNYRPTPPPQERQQARDRNDDSPNRQQAGQDENQSNSKRKLDLGYNTFDLVA
jgi:hypothetical protein